MAQIKEFPATLLRDELELFDVEPGSEHKGWKVLESTLVDHGRWTITYEIIFQEPGQPEGQAWKARYAVGATEIQSTTPWQNVIDVRAKAVRLVEVLTEIWQETPDEATPPHSGAQEG